MELVVKESQGPQMHPNSIEEHQHQSKFPTVISRVTPISSSDKVCSSDEEDDSISETLLDVKTEALQKRQQRRLLRTQSLQQPLRNHINKQNQMLVLRQLPGKPKLQRSPSFQFQKTTLFEFHNAVPDFLSQRYPMKSCRLNRSQSVQLDHSTQQITLPSLMPESTRPKSKSKVHFATPIATNCNRYHSRRNALCDPEKMFLPQEMREKLQSEFAERKQSFSRKLSKFLNVHFGSNLEEDL